MDPRNARRGYRQRESRRLQAAQWQQQFPQNPPKEGAEMKKIFSCCFTIFVLAVIVLCGVLYWAIFRPAPAAQVQNPTQAPAYVAPNPTQPVVVQPTQAAMPVPVVCTTPSIKAGLNTADTEMGEYLNTILGERMTYTSRRLLVPDKAWNDPLTADELKKVETTYQFIELCVPNGLTARVFAGGYNQHTNRTENGVLMNLNPGVYKFSLRNGEIVIWYKNQSDPSSKDLLRIFDQIRNGNFDIHGPLSFFAVSADILPLVPQDLVKKDQMQIVPMLDVEMH